MISLFQTLSENQQGFLVCLSIFALLLGISLTTAAFRKDGRTALREGLLLHTELWVIALGSGSMAACGYGAASYMPDFALFIKSGTGIGLLFATIAFHYILHETIENWETEELDQKADSENAPPTDL